MERELDQLSERLRVPIEGGRNVTIAGQKARILHQNLPRKTAPAIPALEQRIAVFVKDKRAWQVVLTCAASVMGNEEPKYDKMLAKFKFR